jgi:hypothetical protein
MKKIFSGIAIIAIAALVSSCKKTYTCTCSTTPTGGGVTTTEVIEYPNVSKSQADAICLSHEGYLQGSTQTTTCTL